MANPNVCPTCNSRNTGATFGWEPRPVNENETILTGVGFACGDCDGQWIAHGFVMIANKKGGAPSEEAQAAFLAAMDKASKLRIEPIDD